MENWRAKLSNQIRQFLCNLEFEELIPMLMSQAGLNEETIVPFQLQAEKPILLATSPERYLKLAMSKGVGDCFAISPAFRQEQGTSRWHEPEFLMAEWYRLNTDYVEMMQITQDLVGSLWSELPKTNWARISWSELWKKYVGTDWLELVGDGLMAEFAKKRGYNPEGASWEQLFYQISFNEIEPHFLQEPWFLTHFPARISPLCKPTVENYLIAERFELIIRRIEIADGNTENLNAESLIGIGDEEFLEAIKVLQRRTPKGLAGVGLGVDRLAALMAGTTVGSIQGR